MTPVQRIQLAQTEARKKLRQITQTPREKRAVTWQADMDTLGRELDALDSEYAAAIRLEEETVETRESETVETSEDKELRELRESVNFGDYV